MFIGDNHNALLFFFLVTTAQLEKGDQSLRDA